MGRISRELSTHTRGFLRLSGALILIVIALSRAAGWAAGGGQAERDGDRDTATLWLRSDGDISAGGYLSKAVYYPVNRTC